MPPLFAAETSEGALAVLMALSALLGGGINWFATYLSQRRAETRAVEKERRAEHKEDEQSIVSHYAILNERLNREVAERRAESAALNSQLTRALAHLRYLEGIMESKGIKFRPYVYDQTPYPSSGSGNHRPLTEDPEEGGE
jgi:C4-dicarboxylate-specific signal transduction histidine kinase